MDVLSATTLQSSVLHVNKKRAWVGEGMLDQIIVYEFFSLFLCKIKQKGWML